MGRTPCCDKNGLKKGPWTPEEDFKLIQHIQLHGPRNWRTLPKNAGLQRCGKSCRLRWTNYLRPDIKRGRFSFEEEETIIQLHSILGNKWSAIAARLPGRTDNEIKNYWNTHIRKRLLRMGTDPVTHRPRLDLLDISSLLASNQLNLSSLLSLQSLLNPELLRLTSLLASNQENPETLIQKLHENQICNNQLPNQTPLIQTSQFQSTTQDIQPLNTSNVPYLNQTQVKQGNIGHSFTNLMSLNCQNLQENPALSGLSENLVTVSDYGYLMPDNVNVRSEISENLTSFQSLNNCSSYSQNFSFDSVMSTPLSGSSATHLNSSSTFINGSSPEDERESYRSDLLKFEIPESLDFDNFM